MVATGDEDSKATLILHYSVIPTHLIPHCVRNDKYFLWVLHLYSVLLCISCALVSIALATQAPNHV